MFTNQRSNGWLRSKPIIAAFVATSCIGLAGITAATAAPEEAGCSTVSTSSGNISYDAEGGCGDYSPDIAAADSESQQMALGIFMGALKFCINYPTIEAAQAAGYDSESEPDGTHHFFPEDDNIDSVDDLYAIPFPSTAMINDDGTVGGYMVYEYEGFPYIGVIPRTHRHTKDNNPDDEMYHTYCKTTMEEAFRYSESNSQDPPSVEEMEATLLAAEQGGIAAVSTGLANLAGTPNNVMPPVGAATLTGTYGGASGSAGPTASIPSTSTVGSGVAAQPTTRPPAVANQPVVAPWSRSATATNVPAVSSGTSSAREAMLARLATLSDAELRSLLEQLES